MAPCRSPCLAQTLVVHAPVRADPVAGTGCVNSGEAGEPTSGSPLLEGPRKRSDSPSSSTVTGVRGRGKGYMREGAARALVTTCGPELMPPQTCLHHLPSLLSCYR